jgi:hypothetical protein
MVEMLVGDDIEMHNINLPLWLDWSNVNASDLRASISFLHCLLDSRQDIPQQTGVHQRNQYSKFLVTRIANLVSAKERL